MDFLTKLGDFMGRLIRCYRDVRERQDKLRQRHSSQRVAGWGEVPFSRSQTLEEERLESHADFLEPLIALCSCKPE